MSLFDSRIRYHEDMKKILSIHDTEVVLYGDPNSAVALYEFQEERSFQDADKEYEEILSRTDNKDFFLITLPVRKWNQDLSPWKADPVFGKEGFGDGAAATLAFLKDVCEEIDKLYGTKRKVLGGYSLAGLFAVWASYNTSLFTAIASVSSSLWFDGFEEYTKENTAQAHYFYLSLGDKEEKAKNPKMAQVGDKTRSFHEELERKGHHTILEWNEGNHFKDPDIRAAKGFAWILDQLKNYPFYGHQKADISPLNKDLNCKDLNAFFEILSGIWCEYTCAPRMREHWTKENKTLGQCSITSFLVQDLFGGRVRGVILQSGDLHCFNEIDGNFYDLTSQQIHEKLDYQNSTEQFREIHFQKEEKKERYLYLKKKAEEVL